MKQELAVVVNNSNISITPFEMIDAIKEAGFNNVFLQWYNNKNLKNSQEEQLEYAREKGLNVIFVHLGYQRINDLWDEEKDARDLVEGYKEDIRVCSKNGIKLVIMHLTSKMIAPPFNETGINRLKEIVKVAEEEGVKIAFENTKIRGYLEYVFSNIDSNNIGLCYDAGHCHAHLDDEFNYELFKDKILAVHLHDNFGELDEHLLPFDGTINWEHVVSKLKECNYGSYVTLELSYRNDYLKLSPVEFYKEGIKRGEKLLNLFE